MFGNLPIILVLTYYAFLVISVFKDLELTKKQYRIINVVYLVSMVVIAYNFVPTEQMDLYRYHLMLDEVQYMNFDLNQIFNYGPYDETPITSIYFNMMSKIENRALFAAIPTTLIILFTLVGSSKIIERLNINFKNFALFMFNIISVSSLLLLITGVRQNLAWSILMMAVYYDFFAEDKNQKISIGLYILPMLIHLGTIPLIGLRVMLLLVKEYPKAKYLLFIWPIGILLGLGLYGILPSFLQGALDIFIHHLTRDYKMTAKFVIAGISYLLILYLIVNVGKNYDSQKIIASDYYTYYLLVVFFGMSSVFVPTLFERTFEFLMYISLPMIYQVELVEIKHKKYIGLLLMAMFIVLFYWQDLMLGYFW